MTATRSVYASFAAGALAVLTLAACGGPAYEPGSPEALYVELGCAKCHGNAREGLRSGPALDNLQDRWQEERLVAYFRSPKAMMKAEPRLAYMAEQYPIAMPGFPDTDEAALRTLARHILTDSGD